MDTGYVAARVTQLRIKSGFSAQKMSQLIGMNDAYINNIESGKSLPSLANLFNICDFFGISPLEFFDGENSNPKMIKEILDVLKTLNDNQLALILGMAKEFSKASH